MFRSGFVTLVAKVTFAPNGVSVQTQTKQRTLKAELGR
jgi:hypothetical protein